MAETEQKIGDLENEKRQMFAQLKQILMEEQKRAQEEQRQLALQSVIPPSLLVRPTKLTLIWIN